MTFLRIVLIFPSIYLFIYLFTGFKNYLGHDKESHENIYVYPDRHPGKREFKHFCANTRAQTLGKILTFKY